MDSKFNTDTYHYRVNELYRDDAMRAAEQQRLASLAAETPAPSRRSFVARLIDLWTRLLPHRPAVRRGLRRLVPHHHGMKILAAVFVAAALLAGAGVSHAGADMNDPGVPIQHPERVHYFVGMYFYERAKYERAIDEFTITIENLPQMAEAYTARADCYAALEQFDLALDDYARALELNPDDEYAAAQRDAISAAVTMQVVPA